MSTTNGTEFYLFSSWRKSILNQLNERKKHEVFPFEQLIRHCNKLFESYDDLRNDHLHSYNKYSGYLDYSSNLTSTAGSSINSLPHKFICEKCPAIEKKLFSIQEELTIVHRKKDELSTKLIILNENLINKEKDKEKLTKKLKEKEEELDFLKNELKKFSEEKIENQNQKQLLVDEYDTLQITYNSLNKKYLALDKEHCDLVQRWVALKAKDAERLNSENEKLLRIRDEKKKKDLSEAAQNMKILDDRLHKDNVQNIDPSFLISKLPENVALVQEAHEGEVYALKWMSGISKFNNKEVLATGGADRKVKLWSVSPTNITLIDTLLGSNAAITSIDVEGEYLLASSNDFASRLWSISDGKLRRTLTGHSSKVFSVKFLGVPNKVVSGSNDRTIKIWDTNKHVCIRTLFAGSSCHDLVSRTGQESEIISGHFDKKIRFWDIRTESSGNEIALQGKITSLSISPNGYYLLSCDRDDTLKLIDLRMNQIDRTFYSEGFKVGYDLTRAAISPDSEYVVAGSSDGLIFIWNLYTGKLLKILKDAHSSNVNSCTWSLNGKLFISCEKNKKLVVWSS